MFLTFTRKPLFLLQKKLFSLLGTIFFISVLLIAAQCSNAQTIATWDFNGIPSGSPVTTFAGAFAPNVVTASGANLITRGSTAAPSPGGSSFRTQGFKNDGVSVTNTDYFQITLSAQIGYNLSLTKIDAKCKGTNTFPTVTHMFAYSLDGVTFTPVAGTNGSQTTVGTPVTIGQVDLMTTSALQNVPAGTTIYIRYYASGQTNTGGWGFFSTTPGSYGLIISGAVAAASSNTITAGAVTGAPFSLASCSSTASGSVAFTSIGTFTSNTYTAQLSDAAGSFGTPLNIGTLVSNANSGSIPITIPAGTLTSALYTIRIIGSSPSVLGSNSAAFTVNQGGSCFTSATDYFQSNAATGDFTTLSSWQTSLDNGITDPWITATALPTTAAKRVTVRSGHNIRVAANITMDDILIKSGGTLTVAAGKTLTIADSLAAAIDMDVFGTVIDSGAIVNNAGSNTTFEANSIYQRSSNVVGNAIATATWNAASTCSVTGMGAISTGPTNASMGQNFGNFIWSCANQSVPYYVNNGSFSTKSKFTVELTGSSFLSLGDGGATYNYVTGFGSLDVNGGVLDFLTYPGPGSTNSVAVNVLGDVTVTGGSLSLVTCASETNTAPVLELGILNIYGNLSVSGTPANFWANSTTANHWVHGRVYFAKTGTQTVDFSNPGSSYGFTNYYVASGSTLQVLTGIPLRSTSATEFDALTISGGATIDFGTTGTVYQSSGVNANFITSNLSTVITANTDGLMGAGNVANVLPTTGSIRVGSTSPTASRIFTAGTSYIFNGATISAFPTSVLQTAFGAPLNVTLGANITLNRAITMSGTLALGANILTQGGSNLGFSAITGSGSVVGDNLCGITIAGAVGVPGTLVLSGSKTTGQILMNRAAQTLILGSDITIDGSDPTYIPATPELMRLSNGIVDGRGYTITFISRGTTAAAARVPFGGNGSFTVDNTTNLTFNSTAAVTRDHTIPTTTFTVATVSINNLTINRFGTSLLGLVDAFNINGTLTITNGTLDAGTNTLDGTGNFIMTGGKLKLSKNGAVLPEITGTYNLTAGNVEFAGAGTGAGNEQTLRGGKDYYDIIFSGSGERILPNGTILGIKNSITPSTNITTVTNSLVDFKGAAQSIPAFTTSAAAPYTKQFNSVRFSGSGTKTLIDSFTVLDSLKIYTAVSLAMANKAVTLRSGQTQTARVAAIEGSGAITYATGGRFIVERFIPARRAWRLMGAPLQAGEQTIYTAWQESPVNTAANPNPGYGTHVSGGVGKTELMGFDLGPNNSSVYSHNPAANTWNVIPSQTNTYDIAQKPLMLFLRGGRDINLPASTPSTTATNTILRPTGKINTAASPVFSATAGYAAVINPLAAPINFHTISKTNVGDAYYMWDPYLTGSNSVGGWVSFIWNSTNLNYDKSVSTNITNTGVIPSGVAFVVSQSGSGSLSIAQKDVTTDAVNGGNQQPYSFRPSRNIKANRLKTSLFALNSDGTKSLNDGALIVFADDYKNAVDNEDMSKLDNFSENISMINTGKRIVIERRKLATVKDTIFYDISKMKQKHYELQLVTEGSLCNASMRAYLKDKFTNTQTPLSATDTTYYSFAVTADAGTAMADRFMIVFKASGLPAVGFNTIKGFKQNKSVALEWNVSGELDIAGYEVEKSLDGGHTFVKIVGAFVSAKDNDGNTNLYNWLDINPVKGDNYYRVKGIGTNGIYNYSDMVKVSFTKGIPSISIYPNPVVNNTIGLQMEDMPAGNYSINLISQNGQTIFSQKINHASVNGVEKISMNKNISNGIYQLEIVKPNGAIVTLKLMK